MSESRTGGFRSSEAAVKRPPSTVKLLGTSAILGLVVLAWVNFGPRQLGGSVSYVMTHGISMQPRVQEGDLVIVREAAGYQPGDVIAYQSASLHRPVMHRIVDMDENGYITKGDNNDWLDIDRPTNADVIGREWIHIPKAGKILAWFAVPRNSAVSAAVAGLFLFGGTSKKRKQVRRTEVVMMQAMNTANFKRLEPAQQAALGAVGFLALVSLLLGFLGFTKQSVTAVSQESAYSHRGSFTYAADAARSAVYPDGQANTRGPLFLKLIEDIRFTFSYRLDSEAEQQLAGTAALRARINDDHGWQTTLPLQAPTRFRGHEVELSGALDSDEIHRLTSEVQALTGVAGSYTVTIVPVIQVEGKVGGQPINETFEPELPFTLDGLQMTPPSAAAAPGEADPFKPSKPGSIHADELAENRVFMGPLSASVPAARRIAVLGLGLALLLGFLLWRSFAGSLEEDEIAEIEARYGAWLIPVAGVSSAGKKRVHVADIDSLVRLAGRYDRMILHAHDERQHVYVVQDTGVDYVVEITRPPRNSDLPQAPRVPRSPRLREQRRKDERNDLTDHLKEQLRELETEIASKGSRTGPDSR